MAALNEVRKREILLFGYFREIEQLLNLLIPHEIVQIIASYERMCMMFAIGHGQYGTKEESVDPSKFAILNELHKLSPLSGNIFKNNNSLMVIGCDHQLYVIGNNNCNRLGIISTGYSLKEFTKTQFNQPVLLTSRGAENNMHCFVYTLNHQLYACGANYSNEFGNGVSTESFDQTFTFEPIDTTFMTHTKEYITDIECGASCSIFLTNYGLVYSTGMNATGRREDFNSGNPPLLVNLNNDNVPITSIVCGFQHVLALDRQHRLIVWGDNSYGQTNSNGVSIDDARFHQYFYNENIEIKYITAGYQHSLCIDMKGHCWLFGWNKNGQIGNGMFGKQCKVYAPHKISEVIHDKVVDGGCGDGHTVLLSVSNKVITFGDNENNQCSGLIVKDTLLTPYVVSKTNEIGIFDNSLVEKVMAMNHGTIVFVNPNQKKPRKSE